MPSNMKCKICGGWGGEYGDALGVGPMCHWCYERAYGKGRAKFRLLHFVIRVV